MKNKTILILVLLALVIFAILYFVFLSTIEYGVVDYDEYYNDPPCKIKPLGAEYYQISNCAKYKLNREMFSPYLK